MTIDTKRLATDAAYWDSMARDTWATDYNIDEGYFFCPTGYWMASSGRWVGFNNAETYQLIKAQAETIPRPQAPEAEWVDGVPPIGVECEVKHKTDPFWRSIRIDYIGKDYAVTTSPSGAEVCIWIQDHEFRPIPTKAQRDRNELIAIIHECSYDPNDSADAILSRYNLEPKP